MVGNVASTTLGAIHPMYKLDPDSRAGKVTNVNAGNIRQVVMTRSGQAVTIPAMIGSTTTVKALDDGTYEVTTKPSVYNAKPKTTIMTEEELIERFGNKKAKFQTVA